MDFTVFSREDFDPKQWVDGVFAEAENKDNVDSHVATLVMKLQLMMQEINGSLDENSQRVIQGLPRVMRELNSLKNEASRLGEQIAAAKVEVTKRESESVESMRSLSQLDRARERMVHTSKALRESDNWATLVADIDEVVDSGSLSSISAKVSALEQSLAALQHVSDYDDRCDTLEDVKSRLEVLVLPRLTVAFSTRDADECGRLAAMLAQCGCGAGQLQVYYSGWLCDELVACWRQQLVEAEGEADALARAFTTLCQHITDSWTSNVRWLEMQLAGVSAAVIMVRVISSCFTTLQSGIVSAFAEALNEHPRALLMLEQCKSSCDRLSARVYQLSSGSGGERLEKVILDEFLTAVYSPFAVQLGKYSRMLQDMMSPCVRRLVSVDADIGTAVDSVVESVSKFASELHSSLDRCLCLSHGLCLPQFIEALGVIYDDYMERVQVVTDRLLSNSTTTTTSAAAACDFSVLRMCLKLLQFIGDILAHTDELSQRLCVLLHDSSFDTFPTTGGVCDVLGACCCSRFLARAEDRAAFEQLCSAVRDGELVDPLASCRVHVSRVNSLVQHALFECMLAPVRSQLACVDSIAWHGGPALPGGLHPPAADLPDFSYAPQEYITQVGQYLMTLPQHLDSYLAHHDTSLLRALNTSSPTTRGDDDAVATVATSEGESGAIQLIVTTLATSSCGLYAERVMRIARVAPAMARQLAADIEYLGNVMEDLGGHLCVPLSCMATLLRCPSEQYDSVAASLSQQQRGRQHSTGDKCARIAATVRQMRALAPAPQQDS